MQIFNSSFFKEHYCSFRGNQPPTKLKPSTTTRHFIVLCSKKKEKTEQQAHVYLSNTFLGLLSYIQTEKFLWKTYRKTDFYGYKEGLERKAPSMKYVKMNALFQISF